VSNNSALLAPARNALKDGSRHEHIYIILCIAASAIQKRSIGYGQNTSNRSLLLLEHGHDRHKHMLVHSCGAHIFQGRRTSAFYDSKNLPRVFG
jgi:hypothetical protein